MVRSLVVLCLAVMVCVGGASMATLHQCPRTFSPTNQGIVLILKSGSLSVPEHARDILSYMSLYHHDWIAVGAAWIGHSHVSNDKLDYSIDPLVAPDWIAWNASAVHLSPSGPDCVEHAFVSVLERHKKVNVIDASEVFPVKTQESNHLASSNNPLRAPLKAIQCEESVPFCLIQRERPGACPCEYTNFWRTTERDPIVRKNKVFCTNA